MTIQTLQPHKVAQLEPLTRLAQPVKELFYLGDSFTKLLDQPLVAVVGSRKVSAYGQTATEKLVAELARSGVVIVSGLAFGVDSIAHKAALKGGGKTIAVLPSGLDAIYPAGHTSLARQILQQGGALVSEYPIGGNTPMKHQFIARNRIIAGLSQGVLITEAAAKSGSLHTAEFALEQGIEVLAVPGNITSPTSEGTNNLIKTGATPVTSAMDVLEILGIDSVKRPGYQAQSTQEEILLQLLQSGVTAPDELQTLSQFEPSEFNKIITMLEINGQIAQTGSGWALL